MARRAAVSHPLFWERAGGAWLWRGQFARVPLPLAWPVYVSHAEASAYARWAGGELPTEAQYHRAAFGAPDGVRSPVSLGRRRSPTRPAATSISPATIRSRSDRGRRARARGASRISSATAGSGRQTIFGPHPGFRAAPAYPEYSAEFFDGQHYVMKGASPVTARELIRPTFRNWFRATYPYVYASFRCVRPAETGA